MRSPWRDSPLPMGPTARAEQGSGLDGKQGKLDFYPHPELSDLVINH